MQWKLPDYVDKIIYKLEEKGFEAYIVGGAVRDMLLGKEPSDYDITTDALPDEIEDVFQDYKVLEVGKEFGTIAIIQDEGTVEVTTFRIDGEYLDGRRPKEVCFSERIIDDLSRRDFTINAMAYNKRTGIVDYFNGLEDLTKGLIRAVGNPNKRLKEDYLRIMRAIRFATQLEFTIEEETLRSCKEYSNHMTEISIERIREEFFKIILSKAPSFGIRIMNDIGALQIFLPEIIESMGFEQHNPHHHKDVFEHTMCVVDNTSPNLHLRLAGLFHDIGKPMTLTFDENGIGHFYGHEKLGAEMTREILTRWKASNELTEKVVNLVSRHMVDHDNIGEKGLKRLLNIFGEEGIFQLLELNKADRLCANGYSNIGKILENEEIIKKIIDNKEVYTKKQLAIDGYDVIKLGYKEGKIIGQILNHLLELVLEKPELNERHILMELIDKQT